MHDQFVALDCDWNMPFMIGVSDECMNLYMEFNSLVENVNVYDIFGTCWGLGPYPQATKDEPHFPHLYEGGKRSREHQRYITAADYTPWLFQGKKMSSNELPPCTFGSQLLDYMNSDAVRTAMHIPANILAHIIMKSLERKIVQLHTTGSFATIIINITTIANIIMDNLERKTVLLLATGSSSFAAELGRGINTRRGNENTKFNQFMADPLKAQCQNNRKNSRTSRSHPPAVQSLTGIDMKLGRDRLHENRRHLYCWRLLEHCRRINTMTMAVKNCQHTILIYENTERISYY